MTDKIEINATDGTAVITRQEKKYRVLIKDYDNLPFDLATNEAKPYEENDTTSHYEAGDEEGYLLFLTRKCTVYNSALGRAAMGDMPKRQLYNKLMHVYAEKSEKAGMDKKTLASLCALVCDEFARKGYTDDLGWARRHADTLFKSKHYGFKRISQYLYSKGITRETIETLAESGDYDDESEQAKENMAYLLERKYRGSLPEDRRKAVLFLMRSGYSGAAAGGFLRGER